MKSSKLILTLLVTITFTAFTYGQKKGKMNRQVDISELKEELNLSEEQTHKLMEARTASSAKMKVLKADEKLTKEEKRKVAKDIRTEHKKAVSDVLSEEQKTKSKELNKRKRAEHKEERKAKSIEMKAYRAEFDSKISAQDKQELERLRNVLIEGIGKGKVKGRNAKPDREERNAFKEAHKAEFESLDALAAKYEGDITSFFDSKGLKEDHKRKGKAKGKAKAKKKAKKKTMKKGHNNKAARFLLMDQSK